MSEFQFEFVAEYEEEAQKALAEAQKMRELAACLSKEVPAPARARPFGYCAELGITFDLKKQSAQDLQPLVARLLEAYPPMELVDLPQARTQKPREFLRGSELSDSQREIYPVVFKYEAPSSARVFKAEEPKACARWWTRLDAGVVEVHAEGAGPDAFSIPAHAYTPDSHTYATGSQSMYHRRLMEFPLGVPAGFQEGLSTLDAFQEKLGSPGARAVVNAVKERLFRGVQPMVTLNMLQDKAGPYQNAFSRLAPSRYLSEEQMVQLVALAEKAAEELKQSLNVAIPLAQANLEQAAELVTQLLSGFRGIWDGVSASKVLQQRISQEIGQGVDLAWLKYNTPSESFEVRLQVSFGRAASPAFKDLRVTAGKGAHGVTGAALGPVFVPL